MLGKAPEQNPYFWLILCAEMSGNPWASFEGSSLQSVSLSIHPHHPALSVSLNPPTYLHPQQSSRWQSKLHKRLGDTQRNWSGIKLCCIMAMPNEEVIVKPRDIGKQLNQEERDLELALSLQKQEVENRRAWVVSLARKKKICRQHQR